MRRTAECVAALLTVLGSLGGAVAARQGEPGDLRRFVIEKPSQPGRETVVPTREHARRGSPPPRSHVTGAVGAGYVHGADWATDIRAAGTFAGFGINLRALTTFGGSRTLVDQAQLNVAAPDGHWTAEAGDLFSVLAGPGRGARLSWTAPGGRRPSLTISAPYRVDRERPPLLTYRDRVPLGRESFIEGELANDGSHYLAARAGVGRLQIEGARRRRFSPSSDDHTVSGSVNVWRNMRLRMGAGWSRSADHSGSWRTAGIHIPLGKLDIAIERAFNVDGWSRNSTTSVMGSTSIAGTQVFHRQQWGALDYRANELRFLQQTLHSQSMATYGVGARLRLTLQMATQWTESGRIGTWEELLVSWQARRGTRVETAVAIPDVASRDRFRVHFTQDMSRRFALELDYGRVAPYQVTTVVDGRPRLRALLLYRFDIATPPGRSALRGAVLDHAGRPVPDALVRLGSYEVTTGRDGRYRFDNVPAGQFDVSLDETGLSADHVWDGRKIRIDTTRAVEEDLVLRVAPLSTITGRVFVDRNRNGTFDEGESLQGAVVVLNDERATTSDRNGNYGFYNLVPGAYVIRLDRSSLGRDLQVGTASQSVTLIDGRPAAGIDLAVLAAARPVIWTGIE